MQGWGDNMLVRHLFASFGDCGNPQVLRHDALELAFRNGHLYHSPIAAWCDLSPPFCDPPIVSSYVWAAGISLQTMRCR
jgi:hypothetical protein